MSTEEVTDGMAVQIANAIKNIDGIAPIGLLLVDVVRQRDRLAAELAGLLAQVAEGLAGGYCCQCGHELCDNCAPSHPHVPAQVPNGALLWRDMKTDSEKANYILSGRAYATGILAHAIQNDVAMAYQRCANYAAHVTDLEAELAGLRAQEKERTLYNDGARFTVLETVRQYLKATDAVRHKGGTWETPRQWKYTDPEMVRVRQTREALDAILAGADEPVPAAVPSTIEETIRTATQYAHNLVVSLHRDHYQDNNAFEPFDDLLGLLSQIDNMICGWKEPAAVPDAATLQSLLHSLSACVAALDEHKNCFHPAGAEGAQRHVIAVNTARAVLAAAQKGE